MPETKGEFAKVEVLDQWRGGQQDASTWTPREAVLEVLRQIDNGELNPKAIVICIADTTIDSAVVSSVYQQSSPDIFITLGLMEHVKAKLLHGEDDASS